MGTTRLIPLGERTKIVEKYFVLSTSASWNSRLLHIALDSSRKMWWLDKLGTIQCDVQQYRKSTYTQLFRIPSKTCWIWPLFDPLTLEGPEEVSSKTKYYFSLVEKNLRAWWAVPLSDLLSQSCSYWTAVTAQLQLCGWHSTARSQLLTLHCSLRSGDSPGWQSTVTL